jgi:hypothetical protein
MVMVVVMPMAVVMMMAMMVVVMVMAALMRGSDVRSSQGQRCSRCGNHRAIADQREQTSHECTPRGGGTNPLVDVRRIRRPTTGLCRLVAATRGPVQRFRQIFAGAWPAIGRCPVIGEAGPPRVAHKTNPGTRVPGLGALERRLAVLGDAYLAARPCPISFSEP